MKIAVLAVQGAFIEHEKILKEINRMKENQTADVLETVELRKGEDVLQEFDGLVLPGGESTVQGKLLRELGMFDMLKKKIEGGLPVLATCAGLILLAENISNDDRRHFGTLPVTVRRNAYGRQLESFYTEGSFGDLKNVPMEFIRAPYIEAVGEDVEVLSRVKRPADTKATGGMHTDVNPAASGSVHTDDKSAAGAQPGEIVAVRYKNQLAMSFHPELCDDTRIHKEFLKMIKSAWLS